MGNTPLPRKLARISLLYLAIACLSGISCLLAMPASALAGQLPQETALVVGVPVDRCPVFYQDADTGEMTGIGVDLMQSVAESAGYTNVTFRPVT